SAASSMAVSRPYCATVSALRACSSDSSNAVRLAFDVDAARASSSATVCRVIAPDTEMRFPRGQPAWSTSLPGSIDSGLPIAERALIEIAAGVSRRVADVGRVARHERQHAHRLRRQDVGLVAPLQRRVLPDLALHAVAELGLRQRRIPSEQVLGNQTEPVLVLEKAAQVGPEIGAVR